MRKMKRCNQCKIVKADNAFYTHEKSGELYSSCSECIDITRQKAREERKVRYENGKVCPGCRKLKPYTDYRPIDAESWKFSRRCDKCMIKTENESYAYLEHVYGARFAQYCRYGI